MSNNIHKRFYPGGLKPPIGHAHKILNSFSNKMPPVSSSYTFKNQGPNIVPIKKPVETDPTKLDSTSMPTQKFVQQNYTYTSKPGIFPDNIKHHVGDPKKGYIVHPKDHKIEEPFTIGLIKDIVKKISKPLSIVRLDPKVEADTKHVNFGEFSADGKSFISYGVLTSSKDANIKTGDSQSFKISCVKMDGAFTKTAAVIPSDGKPIDFIAGDAISTTTAGQRVRLYKHAIIIDSKDVVLSSLGMDFLKHDPVGAANLRKILELAKQNQVKAALEDET